jgi:hypothetical protein
VCEPADHPREGRRRALLDALKRELLEPATIKYAADAVAAELNRLIDDRPARLEAFSTPATTFASGSSDSSRQLKPARWQPS